MFVIQEKPPLEMDRDFPEKLFAANLFAALVIVTANEFPMFVPETNPFVNADATFVAPARVINPLVSEPAMFVAVTINEFVAELIAPVVAIQLLFVAERIAALRFVEVKVPRTVRFVTIPF